MATPLEVTLTSLRPLFFFRFLMLFGFLAFFVAFVFTMPTLTAISAFGCAAEVVLVLRLLTILCFLLVLQLEQAGASPITFGRVARSAFIVRRMTVERFRGPFAIAGGSVVHVFQLSTSAHARVSRDLPSQMFAQVVVHLRVVIPLNCRFDQKIHQIIAGLSPSFLTGRLSAVVPSLGRNHSASQR